MKSLRILIIAALIICLTAVAPAFAKSKTTYKGIGKLKSKTLSMTKVRVSWKKHSIDKYVIYKYYFDKNGKYKKKKIKTVSGKKNSTVLKLGKNKEEDLYVKGVKKKKHGKQVVYFGQIRVFTGLPRLDWLDLDWPYYRSPSEINLLLMSDETGGLTPTGYEIYRKKDGTKKYKRIKRIKAKRLDSWKDTSVEAGEYYYYKVRSYLKRGKKTYWGKMSETRYMGAINYEGRFKVQMESGEDTMVLKVTSDLLNGKISAIIDAGEGFPAKEENVCYTVEKYSDDGENWKPVTKDGHLFRVKPGESFWIQLEKKTDAEQYNDYLRDGHSVGGIYMDCVYIGYDEAYMVINAYSDQATCFI